MHSGGLHACSVRGQALSGGARLCLAPAHLYLWRKHGHGLQVDILFPGGLPGLESDEAGRGGEFTQV